MAMHDQPLLRLWRRACRVQVVRHSLFVGLGLLALACTRVEEQAPPAQAPAPVAAQPATKPPLPPAPQVTLDTLDFAEFRARFAGLRQPVRLDPRHDFTEERLAAYPYFGRTWLLMDGGRTVELSTMDFRGISFRQRNNRLYEMLAARSVPGGVMVYLHTYDATMQQIETAELARYWERDLAWIEKKGTFTDERNYSATYVFYENHTRTDSIITNLLIMDSGKLKVLGESVY